MRQPAAGYLSQAQEAELSHALELQQSGNLKAAELIYQRLAPDAEKNVALWVNYAALHSIRGDHLQSLALLEKALLADKNEAYAHVAHGHALVKLQRYKEAVSSYERAIALLPGQASFHTSLGIALYYLTKLEQALAQHDQAIALQPSHADAHNNRGNVLSNLKRKQEALKSYQRACGLNPAQPIFWCNRGAMLQHFKRYEEALESYDKALNLAPHYPDAHINRGSLLVEMGRNQEALAAFDRALELQPEATEAKWNKGLHLLRQGQFAEGWKLYEARWQKADFKAAQRFNDHPLWLGDIAIPGKTLLIHPEQGLGDVIQFCRYIPLLEAQGVNVVLEVQPPLASLLKTLKGNVRIIAKGEALPPFDLHCPVMSLPHALRTEINSIPADIPYLYTDEAKCAAWEKRLGPKTKPRIGLAWSGSAGHTNDHNRSIPLAKLVPLFELPFEFHSLQKETRGDDLPLLAHMHVHSDELQDFSDTAALVQTMDMVISVDTSVAHLAGALGKQTWLLLPVIPDMRWLIDRSDTPWYPTMRLFRQAKVDDWEGVIAQLMGALKGQRMVDKPMPASCETQETIALSFAQALALHQAGDLTMAQEIYSLILQLDPHHLQAMANLSSLYMARADYENALLLIQRALAIDENLAPLHYNYGKILLHVKMPAEALAEFDFAIHLQPGTPDFYSNRGIALFELNRHEEAIESYSRAIALESGSAEYYNNRGNALGHVKRFEEAMADYASAVALAPEMADAHWNRSLLQLMHGDFDNGLKNYEWRWKKRSFAGDVRSHTKPLWLGEQPIAGKTILVYPEQGLGDTIQFSRYALMLEALGAHVVLEVQPPLVKLLSTISPTISVIARNSPLPEYDFQCPVMSLPLAFKTTVGTIPAPIPYLTVEKAKKAEWQNKLGAKRALRVGVAWSGSATHVNDHNRSMPLELLAPLFQLDAEFHSLQKEVRSVDEVAVASNSLCDHRDALHDFTDTAALIDSMDIIISVDTSVAHLAGALGKKVWLLLPHIPDYRWLLNRVDTPWYPSMRLFRQTREGWPATAAHLVSALQDKLKTA